MNHTNHKRHVQQNMPSVETARKRDTLREFVENSVKSKPSRQKRKPVVMTKSNNMVCTNYTLTKYKSIA